MSAALVGTAAVGYAQMNSYSSGSVMNNVTGRSFVRVLDLLERHYLYDIDREAVMRGAINGALGALDDEFTYYEEPADNEIDAQNLSGEFYGIGVTLEASPDGKGVRVGTVYQGGAAFEAGVQMGDVFVEVDGKDVSRSRVSDVVRMVRGKDASAVKIGFLRGSQPFTVTMNRKAVPVVSVETTLLEGNIGYIMLSSFYNERASEQFRAAVAKMKAAGVQKLILDMRDNGGGLLNAGADVADQFLASGDIVSLRYKTGKSTTYARATDRSTDYKGQLVVLVNSNSASASEIVGGALQDAGRAVIIGQKTFGKGVAQLPFTTEDGGRVAIVNSEWLTPKGRRINKEGIAPDIYVRDTRFPVPLNFTGSGVEPGTKMTLDVDGKKVEVVADERGRFEYVGERQRIERGAVAVQGEATVELERDAQLRAALEYLKTGNVSKDLRMTDAQIKLDEETRSAEQTE